MKAAGLRIGSRVEVSFRVLPQDDVDVPEELAMLIAKKATLRNALQANVEAVLRGKASLPWERKTRKSRAA